MQDHSLKETMTNKGVEFGREYLILDVFQPKHTKKVTGQNN